MLFAVNKILYRILNSLAIKKSVSGFYCSKNSRKLFAPNDHMMFYAQQNQSPSFTSKKLASLFRNVRLNPFVGSTAEQLL